MGHKLKILFACLCLASAVYSSDDAVVSDKTVVSKKRKHEVEAVKNAHITELDLSNERELRNIDFIVYFPNLTDLNLELCCSLKDSYHVISNLTKLRKLVLGADRITTTVPLRTLTNLTSLDISSNDIVTVRDIITLTKLKKLDLGGNSELTDLERLAQLTSLRNLSLDGIFNNDDISYPSLDFIAVLTNLRKLNLGSNDWLFYIKPLVGLPLLTHLDLGCSRDIKDLHFLGDITTLEKLNLESIYSDCSTPSIRTAFLNKLTKLRSLTVDERLDIPVLSLSVRIHKY